DESRRAPAGAVHARSWVGMRLFSRYFSLRVRLLTLVLLMVVPWLLLMTYTQIEERRAAVANVNEDAMRLIRIVTTNQATQVEAARPVMMAFGRPPRPHTHGRIRRTPT